MRSRRQKAAVAPGPNALRSCPSEFDNTSNVRASPFRRETCAAPGMDIKFSRYGCAWSGPEGKRRPTTTPQFTSLYERLLKIKLTRSVPPPPPFGRASSPARVRPVVEAGTPFLPLVYRRAYVGVHLEEAVPPLDMCKKYGFWTTVPGMIATWATIAGEK
jgi:hypothetical protein